MLPLRITPVVSNPIDTSPVASPDEPHGLEALHLTTWYGQRMAIRDVTWDSGREKSPRLSGHPAAESRR